MKDKASATTTRLIPPSIGPLKCSVFTVQVNEDIPQEDVGEDAPSLLLPGFLSFSERSWMNLPPPSTEPPPPLHSLSGPPPFLLETGVSLRQRMALWLRSLFQPMGRHNRDCVLHCLNSHFEHFKKEQL